MTLALQAWALAVVLRRGARRVTMPSADVYSALPQALLAALMKRWVTPKLASCSSPSRSRACLDRPSVARKWIVSLQSVLDTRRRLGKSKRRSTAGRAALRAALSPEQRDTAKERNRTEHAVARAALTAEEKAA